MDIVTATKIIQEQAIMNGRTFDQEMLFRSENLSVCPKETYAAWTVLHNAMNEYLVQSADKSRIQQLACDMKNLNAAQTAYYNSI